MPIRIKDIATRVGVSRGTVDRVLHNRGNVAPHIKQKIENAIADMGYSPNIIASRLVSNKPLFVGVILPHFSEDSFWTLPKQGIENCIQDFGHFNIKIKTVYFNLVNEQSFIDACLSKEIDTVDAVIIAPVYANKATEYQSILKKRNIPIVAINIESRQAQHEDHISYIAQNSYQAGQAAGRLFELSINDNPSILQLTIGQLAHETSPIQQRKQGLQDFFHEKNTLLSSLDILNFSNTYQLRQQIITHINQHGPFNGIFITNSKAYRFTEAMKTQGESFITIGFDLSEEHIGCLERNEVSYIIDQNPMQQGYIGMKLLIDCLVLNNDLPLIHHIPMNIIVKESLF